MTPINWPASLPCLRWEPYGVAPRPGSLEETLGMVTNLSRVYTQNNEVVTCDVVLDATDEPTFRTFYKTTLSMGTQWFNGDILRNGVYENYELCFIGSPPVFTPITHNVVRASFTLLTRGDPLPEPVYELSATYAVNIPATQFALSVTQPAAPGGVVVTISTLATDRVEITKPSMADDPGMNADAWSNWGSDGADPPGDGRTWLNQYLVSNQDNDVVRNFIGTRTVTIAECQEDAEDEHTPPVQLTGHTQYTFWYYALPRVDNRGELSLRVRVFSRV